MDICRLSRHFPPMNLRSAPTSLFLRPDSVRCNLLTKYGKELTGLSIGDKMFILGMGYVGKFFAADLKARGWMVSGSCTSAAKKEKLEELGYEAYVFDANDPQHEVIQAARNHTHLVISIPPLEGLGNPLFLPKGILKSVLKDGRLRWLAFLSTTSVYGDCGGEWVDEDYPVKPSSELARARLASEKEWLSLGHNLGIAAQVFRLGGIYGPGRSAVDSILKQKSLSKGQKTRLLKKYTSRVHVADICQALHACILNPSPGKIYNVVDDDPAPREEVFEFARKLVEFKFPGLEKHHTSPENAENIVLKKSSRGEKRVSNSRMKIELGVKLHHPTYRSGLQSIIERMDSSLLPSSPVAPCNR